METGKQNILVVYNYNRHDFLSYFEASQGHINFYFAQFTSPLEEKNKEYKKFGKAIYWGNYSHVFHLLDTIKPGKVLFHYIESNFHILLNAACAARSIPTFIIDHGIKDVNIDIRLKDYYRLKRRNGVLHRLFPLLSQAIPRLKARLYFNESLSLLPEKDRLELHNLQSGKRYGLSGVLRQPTAYLAISKKTFEFHQTAGNLAHDKPYSTIGIPTFDKLAHLKPAPALQSNVLFIDQGLATMGLLGWTPKNHAHFLEEFASSCKSRGYVLHIKPHPRQAASTWAILRRHSHVKIVSDEELKEILPYTRLIVGFMSTYLLPLAAMPHTALITLENHPTGRLDVSKSFIDAGVVHPVYDVDELNQGLDQIAELNRQQRPNKATFTEEWLYKFDGKAGERLREILLRDYI